MFAMSLMACSSGQAPLAEAIADHGGRIERVEPLSWWVGMNTPLQLMVHGEDIASYEVALSR